MVVVTHFSEDNAHSCQVARTALFCPHCGTQGVLQEQGSGDYYVGEDYYCRACGGVFTFQGVSHSHKLTFQL